jgi:hypothetical protein
MTIQESIILGEIIKYGLGDDYIGFEGQNADDDSTGYQEVRKKIKKIEKFTGLSFNEYRQENGQDKDIIRNR